MTLEEEFFSLRQTVLHGNGGGGYFPWDDHRRSLSHVHLLRSWAELLESGYDWDDLCALVRKTDIVWLSRYFYLSELGDPDYFVDDALPGHTFHLQLLAETENEASKNCSVIICSATNEEPAQVYKQIFQLLAKKPVKSVCLRPALYEPWDSVYEEANVNDASEISVFPMAAETLAIILDKSSCHKEISFRRFTFSEQHGRVLASFQGSVSFCLCSFADEGRSLFEQLGRNDGGLTKLGLEIGTAVDSSSLKAALCTNTSLRALELGFVGQYVPQFFRFIQQNRGLVTIDVGDYLLSPDQLLDIFNSIRRHPTLEELYFDDEDIFVNLFEDDIDAFAKLPGALLSALKENTVLHRLRFENRIFEENVWSQARPYLQANRFRPRFKSLMEESDPTVQRKLFGSALAQTKVNQSPALTYQLLSGLHCLLSEVHTARLRSEAGGSPKKRSVACNDETECADDVQSSGIKKTKLD